jgi:hypothetical protein
MAGVAEGARPILINPCMGGWMAGWLAGWMGDGRWVLSRATGLQALSGTRSLNHHTAWTGRRPISARTRVNTQAACLRNPCRVEPGNAPKSTHAASQYPRRPRARFKGLCRRVKAGYGVMVVGRGALDLHPPLWLSTPRACARAAVENAELAIRTLDWLTI